MSYGAKIRGQRPKTKKQLKEALRDDPESVTLDNTAIHGEFAGCTHRGDLLPNKFDEVVVGPDPYTDRKWYAQVRSNGTVVRVK